MEKKLSENLRIIAFSDPHGNLPEIKSGFDLMLIGGDISPAHDHFHLYQIDWFEKNFIPWVNSLPFNDEDSKVVMIWGNHDYIGEYTNRVWMKKMSKLTDKHLVILDHDEYDFVYKTENGNETLKIFGTPYCTRFGMWAFMKGEEELDRVYSQIPEDIDILLSHDSPKMEKLASITQGMFQTDDVGNEILEKHILRIKPKMLFTGHFHSGNHFFHKKDGIYMGNVSYVDEGYAPTNGILKIYFDRERKEVTAFTRVGVKERLFS